MRIHVWSSVAASLLVVAACGCESRPAQTPGGADVNINRGPDTERQGRVDINTAPGGGVDVEVDRDGKKAVDVDVKPGAGVNVDVDTDEIRDRIKERREERRSEK